VARSLLFTRVADDEHGLQAQLLGLGGKLVKAVLAARGEDQIRPLAHQAPCTGLPDTGAGARDDSHFVLESSWHDFVLARLNLLSCDRNEIL